MLNDSRFTGTFEFVVDKFSEMTLDKFDTYSEPYMIGNLFWKIYVEKWLDGSNLHFLSVYIICFDDQDDSSWECYANVTFSLLSRKSTTEHHNYRTLKRLFCSKDDIYFGAGDFMQWDNILKPENGYIKNDKIIIRAHVEYSFLVGLCPCQNRSLDSNSTNSTTTGVAINESSAIKTAENEKKIESLETELSQLKIDLMNEKSNAEKMSDEFKSSLSTMQEKITSLEELLKTEKLETAKKLKDFSESKLKIDLLNEKNNTEEIPEELKTISAEFESSLVAMEEKVASLEELLKTENLETA